jgi:hypothetical protein
VEFTDYYTNVSPNFKEDAQFAKFVNAQWGLY